MTWRCVETCGACCYLAYREHVKDVLTLPEQVAFAAMVGADGWCVYFDQAQRHCRIYDSRPDFCVVSLSAFEERYGIPAAEFDEFAIDCCEEHIRDRYGDTSPELARFAAATA